MPYALLADAVVILHASFIAFAIMGGILVYWRRGVAWIHIPCVLWGILIALQGWICPLTYLEADLRNAAGAGGYTGGFIQRYLLPLIYPAALTHGLQMLLGLGLMMFNIIVYMVIWRRWRIRNKISPD